MRYISLKNTLQAVGFSLFFANNAMAAPIKATVLEQAAYTKKDIQQICKQIKNGCDALSFTLFQDKNAMYLFDTSKVVFLEKEKPYKIKQIWDFSDYKKTLKLTEKDDTYVYPVFYPINKTEKAIAFVSKIGDYPEITEYADFIALQENGKYRPILKGVLFSKMIVGNYQCDTDEGKFNNPHCSDEINTTLSIQYEDDGKPYYRWGFSHTTETWKAGVSDKMKTKETSEIKWVRPFEEE